MWASPPGTSISRAPKTTIKSRYTALMKFASAIALLCAVTLPAQAQWQWLDNNGKKVFSDRPPSMDVPEKNILRRPGTPSNNPTFTTPAAAVAQPAASVASLPRPSGKDASLEKKKAQLEATEAAKKKAEEEKSAAAKADNCERARRSMGTLQSGVRIPQFNSNGEREFMSDEARTSEIQRLQGIMASDCN